MFRLISHLMRYNLVSVSSLFNAVTFRIIHSNGSTRVTNRNTNTHPYQELIQQFSIGIFNGYELMALTLRNQSAQRNYYYLFLFFIHFFSL